MQGFPGDFQRGRMGCGQVKQGKLKGIVKGIPYGRTKRYYNKGKNLGKKTGMAGIHHCRADRSVVSGKREAKRRVWGLIGRGAD